MTKFQNFPDYQIMREGEGNDGIIEINGICLRRKRQVEK